MLKDMENSKKTLEEELQKTSEVRDESEVGNDTQGTLCTSLWIRARLCGIFGASADTSVKEQENFTFRSLVFK